MSTYVFSLGLIPVQEWIEEARRSRDLRAGSVFLWWVMAKVLARLEQEGAKVLLPRLPDEAAGFGALAALSFEEALEETYGVPNRASGWFEGKGENDVRQALGALQSDVVERAWASWKNDHLPPSKQPGDAKKFWHHVAEWAEAYHAQISGRAADCPLSLVWVAKPWNGDLPGEGKWLDEVDILYAQVKRTRPLRPWPAGAPIGKCNQCGKREAFGPRESFKAWREELETLDKESRWLEKGFRVDAGERLCYVCLTRRMAAYARDEDEAKQRVKGRRHSGFPSTGEIAARPWLGKLGQAATKDKGLAAKLEALQESSLGQEDLGRALFLGEAALERSHPAAVDLRRELRAAIRNLNRTAEQATEGEEGGVPALPEEPCAYLALLTFDGDDMGEHVRKHDSVPGWMARFQEAAGVCCDHHDAAVFYLGGDEGLVMAPATQALPLALELGSSFEAEFAKIGATLSLGLVFFEQSRPMMGAIRAAREALRRAKAREGKNALTVGVETASGNRWWVGPEPWGVFWSRLETAVCWVRRAKLAAGWAYDVERFLESLAPATWAGLASDLTPVRAEVQRLLYRRLLGVSGEARRQRGEELWRKLDGDRWWESPGGWPAALGKEQFHLVGFLGRLDPLPDDQTQSDGEEG